MDNIVIHLSKNPGLQGNNLYLSVTVRLGAGLAEYRITVRPLRRKRDLHQVHWLLNEEQLLLDKVFYDQ